MISVNGYFEGPNQDLSWQNIDAEMNRYTMEMLNAVDTLIFGRVTYELMARYWPSTTARADNPHMAYRMNSIPKIVFSKTLKKAEWSNTRLVNDNLEKEIKKLKEESPKDSVILGSGSIMTELARHGLIDEFRVMINPIVLGEGTPLFHDLNNKLALKLMQTRAFKSGNVLLYYEPR